MLRRQNGRVEGSMARKYGDVFAKRGHAALRVVRIEQALAVILPRGNSAGAIVIPRKPVLAAAGGGVQFEDADSAEKGAVRHEHFAIGTVYNLRVDGVGRHAPLPARNDEIFRDGIRPANLRGVRQKQRRIIVAELRCKTAVQPVTAARGGHDVGRPQRRVFDGLAVHRAKLRENGPECGAIGKRLPDIFPPHQIGRAADLVQILPVVAGGKGVKNAVRLDEGRIVRV